MEKVNVVVGGGIAGIFSAFWLSKAGKKVVLLEKSPNLGGLLRSKEIDGQYYDFGTHILRETGDKEIDEFLFEGIEFIKYDHLKYGTFHGSLFEGNGFLTDRSMSENDRSEALKELIEISKTGQKTNALNLEEQLNQEYGKRYTEVLLKPVVNKLFHQSADTLAKDAHHLFGLSRLICGSSEETKALKANPYLDSKLAYHSFTEGLSTLKSIYPKKKGVGAWVDLLEKKLLDNGVEIIKGTDFSINGSNTEIESLTVENETREIENLYWTVPPIFLIFQLGLEKPKSKPPQRLSSVIVDILFEGDYRTDLHYFQVYDPDLTSFRITCYDNFNPENNSSSELKRISVEFLTSDQEIDSAKFEALAEKELIEMNVLDLKGTTKSVNVDVVKGGFPIPTPDFKEATKALVSQLEPIKNLTLFGKASGKVWFMTDVLKEIQNHFKTN